jgi:putative ABC transport system substrate-binding protein
MRAGPGKPGAARAAVLGLLAGRPGDGGSAGGRSPGALYITGDNTVMAAFADVLAAAGEHRVPVFINDPGFVEQGAVAGLGPDFRKAGVAGGRLLAEVLDGRRPGALPLRRCSATQLYVNPAAAAALGVRLPAAVLDRAAAVVGPTP